MTIKINREVNVWSIVTTVAAAVGTLAVGGMWVGQQQARLDVFAEKIVRLEAADVKFATQIDLARDTATARQDIVINRLSTLDARSARVEAILERLERRP
jgi:hypothetical protein